MNRSADPNASPLKIAPGFTPKRFVRPINDRRKAPTTFFQQNPIPLRTLFVIPSAQPFDLISGRGQCIRFFKRSRIMADVIAA
jgi:hypothetical protein